MSKKKIEKKAPKIEDKAIAIIEILANTPLYDIAMIFGAVFNGIIHSTEIEEWKAKAFAQLVEDHIIKAVEFEYNAKEE